MKQRRENMECENCGKIFPTQKSIHVLKNGKKQSITFCSYDCYFKFWAGVPNFEPLPQI